MRAFESQLVCGRFIEYSASSPVAAVEYLKTDVNAVVDHSDHDESRQVDNVMVGSGSLIL